MLLTKEISKSPPCSKVANKNLEYDHIREVKHFKKRRRKNNNGKTIILSVSFLA